MPLILRFVVACYQSFSIRAFPLPFIARHALHLTSYQLNE
jgi:hypothetical protein